jgi:hypothetical protein
MPEAPSDTCRECRAPVSGDQRYCLHCGARVGVARLDILSHARGWQEPEPPARAASTDARMPTPRVAASVALVAVIAGVALGAAAGPGSVPSLAAESQAPLTIVALAPPALAAPPAAAPSTPTEDLPVVQAPSDSATPVVSSPVETPATPAPDSGTGPTSDQPTPTDETAPALPPIKHVWVIALADHGYGEAFGPAAVSPYLSTELRAQGALLPSYYAVTHPAAPNGTALVGGRAGPADAVPYPAKVASLADQLTGAGLTWKAYVEDLASVPPGTNPCTRPDPRNPFLSFHSVLDSPDCPASVVGLDRLAPDLAAPDQTPAFSYLVGPATTEFAATEPWLRNVVGQITATKAYKDDGLIVVTFDQAGTAGPAVDTRGCCGVAPGKGGGRVGALLLSPFVEPGDTIALHADHYTVLRAVEDVFGLPHLGHADDASVLPLTADAFKRWSPNVHAKTTGR